MPYLIIRKDIEKVVKLVNDKKNIIIFGEFGNGKTIFLKELASHLARNGLNVYVLEDGEGDYIGDLEKFISLNFEFVLIIDGYDKYLDFIEHFGKLNPNKIRLVLSSRTGGHEHSRSVLNKIKILNFREINIDLLGEEEIYFFIKIIDNIGRWGDDARSQTIKALQIEKDFKN